jgi:hypothetical protein
VKSIENAMWAGDLDKLHELAACICCCHEHTFEHCPARVWDGCRGSGTLTFTDTEEWRAFYGMTETQFYNLDTLDK